MADRAEVAVIMVNYRTPELVVGGLRRAARDFAGAGVEVEGLVVDNSGDFEPPADPIIPLVVCRPGENIGYGRALNQAVDATRARWLILQNPDVEVQPGCLPRLVETLRNGVAAAGPRLYWDRDCRLLMPPLERRRMIDESLRAVAGAWPAFTPLARRRWRRHARFHWTATGPVTSFELSGAILAVRRDVWSEVGPMDHGYRLYFEEQDWLLRLQRAGHKAFHVPDAVAVHAGGRAVARQPAAARWFEQSHARFRRRHLGSTAESALRRVERWRHSVPGRAPGARIMPAAGEPPTVRLPGGAAWVEIAIHRRGFPAAAEQLPNARASCWQLPTDVWLRREADLFATVVDERGRELQARQRLSEGAGEDQNRSVSARV